MIIDYCGNKPNIHENTFVAENSTIIGDVTLCQDVNVWYGAVLRGDENSIYVGAGTNIQDNAVVHVDSGNQNTIIGKNVTVGHSSIIHGAKIGDYALIGMGAIILNNAEIGDYTIIGAGSLVTQGKKIPSGVLCLGNPAKVIRELTVEERVLIGKSAENYIECYKKYLCE